jgi:hypothetical protein
MNKHNIEKAIAGGEGFLLNHHDADGFWRDYALPPGPSEAWTTAYVGWVLANAPTSVRSVNALRSAADALHTIRRSTGWGYNRTTATDADSTAWTWRFLASLDDLRGVAAAPSLHPYLSKDGGARTFLHIERFGTWALHHADVTPVVGLALIEIGSEHLIVDRVRRASLESRRADGIWTSFWWSTDAYATARNLEFLAASGGLPREVSRAARDWLLSLTRPSSPSEAAHHLMIATTLGICREAICMPIVEMLLDSQLDDCGWGPSSVLRVPNQWKEKAQQDPVYEDTRRLMSTAMAIQALKAWLLAGGPTVRGWSHQSSGSDSTNQGASKHVGGSLQCRDDS